MRFFVAFGFPQLSPMLREYRKPDGCFGGNTAHLERSFRQMLTLRRFQRQTKGFRIAFTLPAAVQAWLLLVPRTSAFLRLPYPGAYSRGFQSQDQYPERSLVAISQIAAVVVQEISCAKRRSLPAILGESPGHEGKGPDRLIAQVQA